jgi:hypothetical protein
VAGEVELPHAVTSFGFIPGRPGLHFALSGRQGDALAFGQPTESREAAKLLSHRQFRQDEPGFTVAASAADGTAGLVYLVTRTGELRTWDTERNLLSEPVALTVPHDLRVPLEHLLVLGSRLYLGLAQPELAAQGKSELVYVFSTDGGIFREVAFAVWPPAEKLALTPDGARLLSLARVERSLTVIDAGSGELVRRIEDVGTTPVAFVVHEAG